MVSDLPSMTRIDIRTLQQRHLLASFVAAIVGLAAIVEKLWGVGKSIHIFLVECRLNSAVFCTHMDAAVDGRELQGTHVVS